MSTSLNKKWKQICKIIESMHDAKAKKQYEEKSCGYCWTEDCSCDGFSESCDCSICEDLYNREEYGSTGISGFKLRTYRELAVAYIFFDQRKEIESYLREEEEYRKECERDTLSDETRKRKEILQKL